VCDLHHVIIVAMKWTQENNQLSLGVEIRNETTSSTWTEVLFGLVKDMLFFVSSNGEIVGGLHTFVDSVAERSIDAF